MFVLIWATLLFSVRGNNAVTGAAVKEHCDRGFCITLSEGEITAEAGLCVVIPCSFTTPSDFTPKHMVWYKCEPYQTRCGDSDVILHTNNNNKVQSGFKGRVSLLEPDVSLRNCSIIINDLTESDSGSYQLRANGLLNYAESGYTFLPRAIVSVKGLTQKPTVMIPPLTEGQQTTLTCTAPGLCSGSDPNITWTWRGAGEKHSHITGNITAVTQRHSSTLTFNPSAEQHGTDVTCKVSFTNSITTEETGTLNVTYVKEFRITGNTSVKEGETLNLTCSVESFPPSLITWTKPSETNMQNATETNWQNNTETFMQRESGIGTFSISNVTTEDSGRYICRAEYLNQTLVENVDVKVIYMRKPLLTGDTTVEEGDALNLTCSVESFPPSHITWTVLGSNTKLDNGLDTDLQNHTGSGSNTKLDNGLDTDLQNHTGSATLVIPNVTTEDSGRYICRAEYLNQTLVENVDVKVTYMRKPLLTGDTTVEEGDALNLTCSVESFPPSHITWTVLGSNTKLDNGLDTDLQNHTGSGSNTKLDNGLDTDLQNHTGSATLVIPNVTTEDSGRYICRAEYLNQTLVENVDVKVTYMRKPLLTGDTTVEEGDALNLTCSVESFPPSHITWTVLGSNTKLDNGLDTDLQNHTGSGSNTKLDNGLDTDLQNHTGSATLVIPNVTTEDSGRYICRAEYLNQTLVENVDVKVTYMRKPLLTGDTTVEEGDALNLTCSVESFPPSHITWAVLGSNTKLVNGLDTDLQNHTGSGSNTKLDNGLDTDLQNHTGSATLVIPNVTTEDSGQYICTARHLDRTVTTYADVTVTRVSKILKNSGCEVQSEVLTCVCISEGFPLPTINWPLLKNHTEYTVTTTVSNHTVNSTVTLTVKDHSNASVECVSINENGEAKENLKIRMTIFEKADQSKELVSWLEVIIAFLIGVLLSSVLCCLATKCHRKNQKISRNLDETLEMVTSQEAPLIDAGEAVDDDLTFYQELAEGEEGAAAAEQAAPDLNGGPKDVQYASIDFSVLRRKNTRYAAKKQESTETEYAEIKKEVKEEMENNGEEEGYVLEGEMVTEDEETTPCVPEEDDGEDAAVYSNVKDIMAEI